MVVVGGKAVSTSARQVPCVSTNTVVAVSRARPHPRSHAAVFGRRASKVVARASGSEDDAGASSRGMNEAEVTRMRRQLDRSYMKGKIDDAVKDAVEICENQEDKGTKNCAIAWEEVEELRQAVERKLGEGSVGAGVLDAASVLDEAQAPSSAEAGAPNFQPDLQRQNFLSDVSPCDVEECEEPGGTLLAAGALESTLKREKREGRSSRRQMDLKAEIQLAISDAFDACGEESSAEDCAIAWEKVEELSHQLDREEELGE